MKKMYFLVLLLICTNLNAQVELTAGMGIGFVNNSSVEDYVNVNFAQNGNNLSTFNSAIDFYIEGSYAISESFQLALEYDMMFFSYTDIQNLSGNYELSYDHLKPSLIAYYVINGFGYNFKFGGGGGPRFIKLDEKLPFIRNHTTYNSNGFGLLLKAQGNTLLGGNFYANIAADMRYDIAGEPEANGKKLYNNALQENVNINSLSFGVKLGVTYIF
ncbi:MAG: hypothetical protein KJ571_14575 [Bacteroidetes bacterium]|nr:hypothetical protein [Bacteroidota bacterium]